eukprot:gene6863-30840_t
MFLFSVLAENEHNSELDEHNNPELEPTNIHAPEPLHLPPKQPSHHENDEVIPEPNRRSGKTERQQGQYATLAADKVPIPENHKE